MRYLGTFAPRNLGVLRKDAVPYECPVDHIQVFEHAIRAGLEPAPLIISDKKTSQIRNKGISEMQEVYG